MIPLEVIVAVDACMGIGKAGTIPWRLPGDMRHLKQVTTWSQDSGKQNGVVMGRVTWESLPAKFQPLPNRTNFVLTRQANFALPPGVHRASTFEAFLARLDGEEFASRIETVFVLGGAAVYRAALSTARCNRIHVTRVDGDFACDTFFDGPTEAFVPESSTAAVAENGISYRFEVLRRR
ncbi:MAG: dihydrofolate reductase [Verrucomicrobia bacterium]|nr:dihydrofolate reductase [Verrucomicrobiota bacterium]MDA1087725.1 dihydrofolate reductase [Verrucomicrobiota bacterium]